MATSIGLAGAGMASAATPGKLVPASAAPAATPALSLTPGAWTVKITTYGTCQVDTFTAGGTFSNSEGSSDAGIWAGGGSTIAIYWNAGADAGLIFSGLYSAAKHEYTGKFGGIAAGAKGKVVKGEAAGC